MEQDRTTTMTNQEPDHYWSIPTADLFRQVNNITSQEEKGQQPQQLQEVGLTNTEANRRLSKYGKNLVESKRKTDSGRVLSINISKLSVNRTIIGLKGLYHE